MKLYIILLAILAAACNPQPKGWSQPTNIVPTPAPVEQAPVVPPVSSVSPVPTQVTPSVSTKASATTGTLASETKRVHKSIANFKARIEEERAAYAMAEYNAYYSTCLRAIVTWKIMFDVTDPPPYGPIDLRMLRFHCTTYAIRKLNAN